MFCWIEKVGCSRFKEVFSKLHRHMNHSMRSGPGGHHYSTAAVQRPSVHKALFYREPMERFLSGYLDKCQGRPRIYCQRVFGGENRTFSEAVFLLKDMDPIRLDVHFNPQIYHCGGLSREMLDNVFSTVEQLKDPNTTRLAVKNMLQNHFHLTEEQFDNVYPDEKQDTHKMPMQSSSNTTLIHGSWALL